MQSSDQNAAMEMLEAGKNVFLTGPGGTGKTTLLNRFQERNPHKNIVHLGTTGAAASLVNGQTMHSFFHLPSRPILPGQVHTTDRELINALRSVDVIAIDEISMARIDAMQGIRDFLMSAAKGYGPFGGFQLVLSGDFFQNAPVVKREDKGILEQAYGEGNIFAFQNKYFKHMEVAQLHTIHRQKDDAAYANWLNLVRTGQVDDFSMVNERVGQPQGPVTHLVGTHEEANQINQRELERLPVNFFRIRGKVQGRFDMNSCIVPPEFKAKPNSRVIICANNKDLGYHNGSAGTLLKCGRNPAGEPVAFVQLDSGKTVRVEPHTWESEAYQIENDQLQVQKLGSFRQLPIIPGWAITIHRSQGMTLDAAHIGTDSFFSHGQAYVALSRVKSLSGLTLEKPLSIDSMIYDKRVMDYMGIESDAATHPSDDMELVY